MAGFAPRPWYCAVTQGSADSDTDSNTEAIIFFPSRKSFGYRRENWRRSRPRRSPWYRSQYANAYPTTDRDRENEDIIIDAAQISHSDAHTGESGEIADSEPNVTAAENNFARSDAVTDCFGRESKRIADVHVNTDADINPGAHAVINFHAFEAACFSFDED